MLSLNVTLEIPVFIKKYSFTESYLFCYMTLILWIKFRCFTCEIKGVFKCFAF